MTAGEHFKRPLQYAIEAIKRGRISRLLGRLGHRELTEQSHPQILAGATSHPEPISAEPVAAQSVEPEQLARVIAERYAANRTLFSLWESHGFHITPVHYYSPIPNVSALPDEIWKRPSRLIGVDLNERSQLAFLDEVCSRFRPEYGAFPNDPTDVPFQYYFNQGAFGPVDAEVLYCMIRHWRPRCIVEVGSGFSTYLAATAVVKNGMEGHPAELITIDPHPNEVLRHGFSGLGQLRRQPVQNVELDLFTGLTENDILFIDSSHVVRIDSEVRFLLLEVVPRLKPGVLVHFHDIFLPNDYPRWWVVSEHRFWNEQYVLQAFLAFNRAFETVWAGSYMHMHHSDRLKMAFSSYDPTWVWPGSYWIRRLTS